MNKNEATKYILLQLSNWYYELNPSKRESGKNDLSILKSLKLIFFLCSIENHKKESLLDKGFDKFKALPLGPVETDLYDSFLSLDNIIDYKQVFYENIVYDKTLLGKENIAFIDECFNGLKAKNNNLVIEDAFTLVDLTHEWNCWLNAFNEAKSVNKKSKEITVQSIKDSNKIYSY